MKIQILFLPLHTETNTKNMKRFNLSGNTANWNNGLRMSALNLATLTEEVSTPIPADSCMLVSVANNIFHVNDVRREVISGEIADADKNAILSRIKYDTPDFLLTLEDKVVGYACLHYRKDGTRVNEPVLDEVSKGQLDALDYNLAKGLIDETKFNELKETILSEFAERVVKPIDGAILLVANVTPATTKHSFKKDGLTQAQRVVVYDFVLNYLEDVFNDSEMATDCADAMIDEIVEDIQETADWEDYEDDEWNSDDVTIALHRVMHRLLSA